MSKKSSIKIAKSVVYEFPPMNNFDDNGSSYLDKSRTMLLG